MECFLVIVRGKTFVVVDIVVVFVVGVVVVVVWALSM